jgi:acyl-coenzyme A synthetase/AMP-(fatty) acid ligase
MIPSSNFEAAAGSEHWILERLEVHGEKTFLHMNGCSRTYADLWAAIVVQRRRLDLGGVVKGQSVALLCDYSFDAIALFLALLANRNVIVPLTTTVPEEAQERLALLRIDWVCREPRPNGDILRKENGTLERHELLTRVSETGHSALVLFSSGSSGRPKAMVHDLDRLLDSYRDRRSRDLTLMVFLMFDHIGGLNTLFTALASGATMVIPSTREPDEVCALVARHLVAVLPASPTFLNLVLLSGAAERHDLGSLRIITYGTEPMPESLLVRLRTAFPKVKLLQTFGTSETGISQTSSLSSSSTLLRLDDPNIEHCVVEGELWLRSRYQILGYLNHSMESFTKDGWFKTGDMVEEAGDGFIRIKGRLKELINVGGQKVLPAEVESILLEMPQVEDCLVYGEPNPITGQIVCAKVVPKAGTEVGALRGIVRVFCRARLDSYKVPVKVLAVSGPLFGARFKKQRSVAASHA